MPFPDQPIFDNQVQVRDSYINNTPLDGLIMGSRPTGQRRIMLEAVDQKVAN